MANLLARALGIMVGAGALLTASAASANTAVVFVHGTGDQPPGPYTCQPGTENCAFESGQYSTYACGFLWLSTCQGGWQWNGATANYWGQVDNWRGGHPFLTVNYWGEAEDPTVAWNDVIDQIATYLNAHPDINHIVLATHSDGVNVVRYMAAHHTWGSWYGYSWDNTIAPKLVGVLFSAGSQKGTPLADIIVSLNNSYWFSWIADISGYNGPATWFQQQAAMQAHNTNGTLGNTPDLGYGGNIFGVPIYTMAGWYPSYDAGGGNCGSYWEALGLSLTSDIANWNGYGGSPGWGQNSNYDDGFIGLGSSTYLNDWTHYMWSGSEFNHDESRHDCSGSGATAANFINSVAR